MHTYSRSRKSGFTLVEILIVVIILGILAAIVIPQFTNASQDARESSLTSQLQTLRSQVELYKLQHQEDYPTSDGTIETGTWDWDRLVQKTDDAGDVDATDADLGPYLQQQPINALTGGSFMVMVADDATALADTTVDLDGANPDEIDGFVFSRETGKIWAYTRDGTYLEGAAEEEEEVTP